MKLRGSTLFAFLCMFLCFLAGNSLWRLHQLGQPIVGLVIQALGLGVLLAFFDWLRSGAGDKL
jgi:hypothetical protein